MRLQLKVMSGRGGRRIRLRGWGKWGLSVGARGTEGKLLLLLLLLFC